MSAEGGVETSSRIPNEGFNRGGESKKIINSRQNKTNFQQANGPISSRQMSRGADVQNANRDYDIQETSRGFHSRGGRMGRYNENHENRPTRGRATTSWNDFDDDPGYRNMDNWRRGRDTGASDRHREAMRRDEATFNGESRQDRGRPYFGAQNDFRGSQNDFRSSQNDFREQNREEVEVRKKDVERPERQNVRGGNRTRGVTYQKRPARGDRHGVDVLEEAQGALSALNVNAEEFQPIMARMDRVRVNGRRKSRGEESKPQKESLEEQLLNGVYDCVICCLRMRNTQPIWNCQSCFHMYHLKCVREWATTSTSIENQRWRCPACQNESSSLPEDYLCFCGKQKNPQPTKMSLPHSCTQLCGKGRSCPHNCNKLCHPGRCPPCEGIVARHCHCGKTTEQMKCESTLGLCCDQRCGKVLKCGKHFCEDICHPESCIDCQEVKTIKCVCGRESKEVECSDREEFNCGNACGKKLPCGNHMCERKCHSGNCGQCHLSQVKTCSCGKQGLPLGWTCANEVPLCGQICGRKLGCGHDCPKECHSGGCPPCAILIKGKRCRCGNVVEEAACGEVDILCKRKCNKKKNCGRHKCLDLCCDKEFHICDLVCGKKLSCNLHSCSILCHKGSCRRCDNVSFDELSCHCGSSVLYPPIACNATPPECFELCRRPHRCNHPVWHPCHSDENCPPCTTLTQKLCHGGHETRKNIPCHLENVSCGRPCGKPLSCGRHRCDKSCHHGECPTTCEQPCQALRTCGHVCKAPCHQVCPKTRCWASIEVGCSCGLVSEQRTCYEFQQIVTANINQKIRRGEEVNLNSDIASYARGFLKCVDKCALEERNRKLAEAFQIDPNETTFTIALYTDFVKDEAKKNWNFASKIVLKLTELVELAKSSKQSFRTISFEPMAHDQRRFIHELLEAFRCTGQSYDQEPKRNVVVTAHKEKSCIPTVSLASVIGILNPAPINLAPKRTY